MGVHTKFWNHEDFVTEVSKKDFLLAAAQLGYYNR